MKKIALVFSFEVINRVAERERENFTNLCSEEPGVGGTKHVVLVDLFVVVETIGMYTKRIGIEMYVCEKR